MRASIYILFALVFSLVLIRPGMAAEEESGKALFLTKQKGTAWPAMPYPTIHQPPPLEMSDHH
jgi:hypothetical protein